MLNDQQIAALRQRIADRLLELDQVEAASQDSRDPVTLDQAAVGRLSRIDAMQQQAMALATQRRRQTERQKLRTALEAMASGDYGACARCGEEIAIERLNIDPAAPFCLACMRGREG